MTELMSCLSNFSLQIQSGSNMSAERILERIHYLDYIILILKLHIILILSLAIINFFFIFTKIIAEHFLNLISASIKGQNTVDQILC